ncbi:DNA-3-methyladenine glycosylase [Clostridium sp.]|uniref:DNA-3-methyladenine glycosylase n=1 Tax=Clostridium sp. TaxID=1506 RepID=UPI003F2B9F47
MILEKNFYRKDTLTVANELLGKILVRNINGKVIRGKIVETEAYIGAIDKASHAYNGRRTTRTEPLYAEGGIAYVYFIYGLYHCFNVISEEKDIAGGVLIRAIEPLDNLEHIANIRFKKKYNELTKAQKLNLTNGPSKLCMALSISKEENYKDLTSEGSLYIETGNSEEFEIVKAKRIGIDYAEEAKDFLWRFYIKDNPYVSVK